MLTIRLQRTGAKNAANFRIVVAEKTAHVSKKFHEVLGAYNPRKKNFAIRNPERLNYWISQRVEISPTVNNLLIEKGLLKGEKKKAFNIPKKEEPKAETPAPAAETKPAEAPPAEPTEQPQA